MTDSVREIAWMDAYTELEDFAAETGHSLVPKGYLASSIDLYQWLVRQRRAHSRGILSEDRTAKLEAVPGWMWTPNEDKWDIRHMALESFAAREGHTMVPFDHVELGERLGAWVRSQRAAHGHISAQRAARLEAIPGWTWLVNETKWASGLEVLTAYAERTGHAQTPNRHLEDDGFDLGGWVARQRRWHKEGALSPERAAALEALPGWIWEAPNGARPNSAEATADTLRRGLEKLLSPVVDKPKDDAPQCTGADSRPVHLSVFGERSRSFVEALNAYAEREDHTDVPARHLEGDVKLGSWVHSRRVDYREGRLSRERTEALESLPGWTWRHSKGFVEGLEHLIRYADREGHSAVPARHVEDGFLLGVWVGTRRAEHRSGLLSPERARLLELVPGWWWGRDRRSGWDDEFAALKAFADREGHTLVPRDHVEGSVRLGEWLFRRKTDVTIHGRFMDPDRIAALEELPGWTWKVLVRETKAFWIAKAFIDREGHSRIPARWIEDGFGLYAWAKRVRKTHLAGSVDPCLSQALSTLPGWSWRPR